MPWSYRLSSSRRRDLLLIPFSFYPPLPPGEGAPRWRIGPRSSNRSTFPIDTPFWCSRTPFFTHGNVRAIHLTSPMISVSGVHARGG